MSIEAQIPTSTPDPNSARVPAAEAVPLGLSSKIVGGYLALSAFVNISPSSTFQIFRRFGTLNARCLLYLQNELCQLEEQLEVMDVTPHDCGTRRFDQHPERAAHIRKITEKITEYNDRLASVSQTIGMRLASQYQYQKFRRWFDRKNPIVREEIDFLRYPQDMIALGSSEQGWLFHKIEEASSRFFTDKEHCLSQHLLNEDKLLVYASARKLFWGIRFVIVLLGLISLLNPILALAYVPGRHGRLSIVCVSTTLFAVIVSVTTNARDLEVLAVTAAYAAVVVVFLGSLT